MADAEAWIASKEGYAQATSDQLSEEVDWFDTQRFGDCDELKHVEAPLSALVLGHERLRSAEPIRNNLLGQPGLFSGLPQERDHALMSFCAKRFAHAP